MGALKVNLPMIAAGDNLVITGVYGEGALNYVTSNQFGGSSLAQGAGGVGLIAGDAVLNTDTRSLRLTKAWAISGGFQHFWTPTLSSTIFGSYGQVDQPGVNPRSIFNPVRDFTMWSVGVNTIWQPVRGLNIGVEGAYVAFDPKGRILDTNKAAAPAAAAGNILVPIANVLNSPTKGSDGQFLGRLRITRDF